MRRGRSSRVWVAIVVAGAVMLTVASSSPAALQGKPSPAAAKERGAGLLDLSFGKRGKTLTAMSDPSADRAYYLDSALGRDGAIYIAEADRILGYGPDGQLNPRFGRGGRLDISRLQGGGFELGAIGVDSQGRLLVAGTTHIFSAFTAPKPADAPPLRPDWATVIRYLPNGKPDPSFGNGGRVETSFDLPAPTYKDPSYWGNSRETDPSYGWPSVGVTGLSVDALDRPVVAGAFVTRVETCGLELQRTSEYVARLTAAGGLDPGFATAGVYRGSGHNSSASQPLIAADGGILFSTMTSFACVGHGGGGAAEGLARLGSDGNADASFGSSGSVAFSDLARPSVTVDRRGRILVAGSAATPEEGPAPSPRVARLLPSGAPDESFGHQGTIAVNTSQGTLISAIAADEQGRVLLTMSSPAGSFQLRRMTASGRLDHGFGQGGLVTTRFGSKASAEADDVAVDGRGRIVVTGIASAPRFSGYAVALARYLGGG